MDAAEVGCNAGNAVIEFAVTDSGIGIPPDKLPLLFTPFSQVDSSDTRQYGGTGLGLTIVRSLAELMNGNAGGDSEPGKGSRFWFRIRADILPDDIISVLLEKQFCCGRIYGSRQFLNPELQYSKLK